MSCWVVPAIAADLWGVSVQQVLDEVKSGTIPTKKESGFTFVDVAPHSPTLTTPKPLRQPTPPTYAVVTRSEITALGGNEQDEFSTLTGEWRDIRNRTERLRRAPVAR